MKPLIVIDCRTVEGQFTGIGRYAVSLVPLLVAARPDWRFHIFAAPGCEKLFHGLPGGVSVQAAPPVPWHPRSDWWLHVTLPRWLADHRAAVFFSAANYAPIYSGATRRAVMIHDLVPFRHPGLDPLKFVLYLRAMLKLSGWVSEVVLANSKNTAREIETILGVPRDRIHLTYLGVPKVFRKLQAAELESLVASRPALAGLPRGFILSVGTHTPRKNFARLIAAMARLPDSASLVLAGPTGQALRTAQAQAVSLGVQDRVRFIDYPDDDGLLALYNLAGLFVYPSLYEGFGFPVVEAMACGTPVACSTASCLPEVAGDAAEMFDPTTEEAIAAALARVLGEPQRASELAAKGPAQAARFTWEQTAQQTAAALEKLL
ncbi:MAG: glycosyltransferase family 4 protein [Candidatus Riflebacteria bacterium]|nr:glycosyltransferase family 4 protein [Candidatus Riflebacteria bacterium]